MPCRFDVWRRTVLLWVVPVSIGFLQLHLLKASQTPSNNTTVVWLTHTHKLEWANPLHIEFFQLLKQWLFDLAGEMCSAIKNLCVCNNEEQSRWKLDECVLSLSYDVGTLKLYDTSILHDSATSLYKQSDSRRYASESELASASDWNPPVPCATPGTTSHYPIRARSMRNSFEMLDAPCTAA